MPSSRSNARPAYSLDKLFAAIEPDFTKIPRKFLGMFYGDNGSGKTMLALAAAEAITPPEKKILFIDTSQGFESLLNHPELAGKLLGRMMVLPFDGESQLRSLADGIKRGAAGLDRIGCIILDEDSTMARYILDVVTEGSADVDESKLRDFNTRPDYNIAGNKFRYIMQQFQRLSGVHVISVAHYRVDEVGGFQKTSPAFQPGVASAIKAELKVIGYCVADVEGMKITRKVQVSETPKINAKTRLFLDGKQMPPTVTPDQMLRAITQWYAGAAEVPENEANEMNEPVEV